MPEVTADYELQIKKMYVAGLLFKLGLKKKSQDVLKKTFDYDTLTWLEKQARKALDSVPVLDV